VDFKTILTDLANFTGFLITNIETISKTIAVVFALNTAFKLLAVASGIVKVAIALQTWVTAQLASGMTIATVATNVLSAAMRLIPFVAIATGIALIVTGIVELGDESKRNKPYVDAYGGAIRQTGHDAEWAAGRYGAATTAVNKFTGAIGGAVTTSAAYDRAELNRFKNMADASKAAAAEFPKAVMPDFSSLLGGGEAGGGASASIAEPGVESINQVNEAQVEAARKEQEILDKRRDAFQSFRDSVKNLFGQIKDSSMSAFSLPNLGNSVNSITKNINKLLAQTKNFASNISKLSSMGLNSTLLQQVIAAGPQAGSRWVLAENACGCAPGRVHRPGGAPRRPGCRQNAVAPRCRPQGHAR
jgi:hypothetical protein